MIVASMQLTKEKYLMPPDASSSGFCQFNCTSARSKFGRLAHVENLNPMLEASSKLAAAIPRKKHAHDIPKSSIITCTLS